MSCRQGNLGEILVMRLDYCRVILLPAIAVGGTMSPDGYNRDDFDTQIAALQDAAGGDLR